MTGVRMSHMPRRNVNTISEPYRILVASGGDASSLGALRLAHALARRRSASVHALAVATPLVPQAPMVLNITPPALVDEDSRRSALDLLRRQLATVRGTREWTMRATVGYPAESIVDAAKRWPASLVVVGIGAHGLADRLIGSETAVKVARQSEVPVLAVPADAEELPLHAVAGIDFTESSVAAAMLAATLLGPNGLLTLLHASQLVETTTEDGSLPNVYTAGAREKLEEIRDRIHRRTKRRVDCAVVHGDISGQLVHAARERECDLIALGGHDRSFVDRLLIGSVRADVLRKVKCAVLIAPPVFAAR